MSAEFQERIKDALYRASDLPGAARDAFLTALDASDPDVAREVRSLLEQRTHPGVSGSGLAAAAAEAFREGMTPPAPGREVGPYRLIEVIGVGGMGAVYRAEQREPIHREVAVKLLVGGAARGRVAERFAAERHALALMDHPGIARILDAGEDATGTPYIAMELVDGVPITHYRRVKRLSRSETLALFVSVCRAVQHAHQKGIVHRDLKPSNVLVSEVDGKPAVKIIDFGIARIVEGEGAPGAVLTGEGQIIGTLEYMSPEQAEGRSREIDTRTDVYSLGVLLYELLTGSLPYDLGGLSLTEAIARIRGEPPRAFRQTRTEGRRIDPDLDTITRKALEKDPGRRYESVGALANDVERYERAEPIVARPPSTTYQLRMLVRRHRVPVLVGGSAIVVLAIFGITMSVLYAGQRRERERAQAEARKAQAVSGFLERMLGSADPEEMGRKVTVREVMDQSLRTIGPSFSRYPDVLAAVEGTLGKAYYGLGEHLLADSLLRSAYARVRRAKGEEDPEAIDLLRERALLAGKGRRYREADSLGGLALRQAIRETGPRSLQTARCLYGLGGACAEDAPAKAESLLTRALDIAREHGEDGARLAPEIQLDLAEALRAQMRFSEAEQKFLEGIRALESFYGASDPRVLTAFQNLAALYDAWQKPDRVRDIDCRGLPLAVEVFGPDHPSTATWLNNTAVHEITAHHYAHAESLQRAAARIWARVFGDHHPFTVTAYQNLGYIEHCRLRYESAAQWYRKAIALSVPQDPRDVGNLVVHMNLLLVRMDEGRIEEARRVAARLRRAVAYRESTRRGEAAYLRGAHLVLGLFNLRVGRYDRAERDFQWMLDHTPSEVWVKGRREPLIGLALAQFQRGDRSGAARTIREHLQPALADRRDPPYRRAMFHAIARHFRATGEDSLVRVCQAAVATLPH